MAQQRCDVLWGGVFKVEERPSALSVGRHVTENEEQSHHNVLGGAGKEEGNRKVKRKRLLNPEDKEQKNKTYGACIS